MAQGTESVACPICSRLVPAHAINDHLDASCLATSETPTVQAASSSKLAPIFSAGGQSSPSASAAKRRPLVDSTPRPSSSKKQKSLHPSPTISSRLQAAAPLAERLRPSTLDDFIGQEHLVGPNSLLLSLAKSSGTGSLIFWGPPGCGKTTLARLLAKTSNAVFKELSATIAGINDVRPIFEEAKNVLHLSGKRTAIFLDEIHRFSRSQQDIFLPYIEQGYVQLIGATTENPSFKINGALLSRCRVFVLERLSDDEILQVLERALDRVSHSEHTGEHASELASLLPAVSGITSSLPTLSQSSDSQGPSQLDDPHSSRLSSRYPHVTRRILDSIVSLSAGDARTALSLLELVLLSPVYTSEEVLLGSLRNSVSTSYDRTGDDRYDLISAMHKSIRGSQPSAALYWLARMLEAGEDPVYICRRLVVCASEDVGLADNHALPLATAAMQACQQIGMPECRINLAHVVSYLAEAPKSTRSYEAYNRAVDAARQDMTLPVPLSMRNAPTRLMKEMGYSKGYMYNPDYAHPVTNEYIPGRLMGEAFLRPAGDVSGKEWDERALKAWEVAENGGVTWPGRKPPDHRA